MTSPARQQRQARDRRISLALAVLIGLVVGIGGFFILHYRPSFAPTVSPGKATAPLPLTLLPHKALYGVSMVSARNGSQVIDIDGKMFFQMHQGCDAYITDHRFVLTYDYADSTPMRVTSDFSTVESMDGKTFDFSSRRRRDGELYQELRGKAVMPQAGMGQAVYALPADLTFDLAAGTRFPAMHTRDLITAARAGKSFLSARIFDGSDEEGPLDVTAIITPAKDVVLPSGTMIAQEALVRPAWRVHLAFFPTTSVSETADYELTMILHENGVISDMTIDYRDFSVHQQLLALDPLVPDGCDDQETPQKSTVQQPPTGVPVPADRPLR